MGEAPSAESDGFVPETMLCLPIFNRNKIVIGVAQLMNKVSVLLSGRDDGVYRRLR